MSDTRTGRFQSKEPNVGTKPGFIPELCTKDVIDLFSMLLHDDDEVVAGTPTIIVHGVMNNFGFDPERVEEHAPLVRQLLEQLDEDFRQETGGGASFLKGGTRHDGALWGEHTVVELLMCMGIATGDMREVFPREVWRSLPGGLPYYAVLKPDAVKRPEPVPMPQEAVDAAEAAEKGLES